MSPRPDPLDGPDAADDATLPGDEAWPVAEQYRVEPAHPADTAEGETVVIEGPPVAGPPPSRRFPPDLGPGLLAALLGVLLVAILVPAGIWLATRSDDEPQTTSTLDTTTEPATTTTPPAERTVPEVVGLGLPEARERLEEENLDARFRRVASEQPRGEVLRQAPAPGGKPPGNGIVVLTVSDGPGQVVLPRVEGLTVDEATAALRDSGLRWETRQVPATEPEGTVVGQEPAAGEEVDRETVVVVLDVAEPPPPPEPRTIEAPDVVGLKSSEARTRLGDLGLRWTQRPVESSRPRGTVVRQSPGAGAELREGGRVTLTVSTGPARIEIPDVVGLDEESARGELRAAGFRIQVVDEPTAEPTEDGVVLDQAPRGGASRPKGSVVTITVARFS